MSTATGEQRSDRLSTMGTRPPETEPLLPCPRCDSTNTKFCYYNNYNLSQPRHFCKSCRRYWTRGGTLRNVPVGGGSRKSSSHKRPRTNQPCAPNTPISTLSSSSGIVAHEPQNPDAVLKLVSGSDSGPTTGSLAACFDVNLNEAVPEALSLSSLLTTQSGTGGYLPFELGFSLDPGSSLNGIGFGLGADWPMESVCQANNGGEGSGGGGENGGSGGSSECNTWQISGVEGGLGTDADCFGWPDLAISMTGKGLK